MRKKREQQKQAAAAKAAAAAAAVAESDKNKSAGDDKILNILSNTENQRLINNLLGIGKTLGLTGKQQSTVIPTLPPPPPPPPENTNSGNQAIAVQDVQPALPQQNVLGSNVAAPPSSWPNQQQWESNQQYNPRMGAPAYGMPPSTMHHHPATPFTHPMMSPNFAQPPPNLPSNNSGPPPNFSQPPPNYPSNNNNNNNQERLCALQNAPSGPASAQDQPQSMDMMRFACHPNDRGGNFDGGQQSNFLRRTGEPPDHRFLTGRGDGIANPSDNEQDQFMRSADAGFGRSNEPFNDRIETQQQRFRRGDRGFPSDFGNNSLNGSMNFHPNNEGRFGLPMNERFAGGNNRFGPDRFPPSGDRPFAPEQHDRFGGIDRFSGGERFTGPEADRFGRGAGNEHRFDRPDSERFGPSDRFERFSDHKDRFSLPTDRFAPNVNESFGASDRFGRGNNHADCFDPKDANDHRRDSFGGSSRLFGRNPTFSPPKELSPELRKLMEKRKAAGDVFRPSFLSGSEKISSVGSLSESFKKIAGDSPFRSNSDFPKIRPGAPPTAGFSSITSGRSTPPPFQSHLFGPDSATSPYGYHPRGHPFNAHDNEPPLLPGFGQGSFSENFAKHGGPMNYNEREMEKDMENNLQNSNKQTQLTDIQSQSPTKYHSGNTGTGVNTDSAKNIEIDNVQNMKDTEMVQPTNEIEGTSVEQKDNLVIEENLSKENDDNKKGNKVCGNNDDSQQQQQQDDKDQDNNSELRETAESSISNKDESILIKKSESLPFMGENDPPPEDLNIEPPPELPNLGPITNPSSEPQDTAGPLNEAFDEKGPPVSAHFHDMRPHGVEFPRMDSPFRFPGPPPLLNPIGPHGFSLERPFQSQSQVNNAHLGPKDGLGHRDSPNRFNDERNRNDESSGEKSRNPNSGQFEPMNEPFGGPRSSIRTFGQVGLRGLVDLPFTSRISGSFGPRSSDMQFGPRGGPNDRHPGDGVQFNFLGPNNRFGRPNEAPFDRRSQSFGFPDGRPNEGLSAFGPRGPNDSMLSGLRGPPPDTFSQGRSPKTFNENRFDSRDFTDSSLGPDFKDRLLSGRGSMGDPSYARDYVRRSETYTRREQYKDDKFERPAARPDEPLNRNTIDIEPWKDNVEYTRRMPPLQDHYKKDIDRKLSNTAQFDERPRPEPKITGFAGGDDKEVTDPKFHGPNLFTKRPQSKLSAGGSSPGEFRAPRQFNYNHGEVGEKKVAEYTPSKVIDYGHTSRPTVVDQHLSPPVQCFDYSHGDSKPVERYRDQHQQQSRKDFRNWVENEQSIKDYAEQMKSCYENAKKEYITEKTRSGGYETRRSVSSDFTKQRMREHHMDWQQQSQQQQQPSDRRPCGERERKDSEDHKERSSMYDPLEEQRLFFERDSSAIDGQSDRNVRRGN